MYVACICVLSRTYPSFVRNTWFCQDWSSRNASTLVPRSTWDFALALGPMVPCVPFMYIYTYYTTREIHRILDILIINTMILGSSSSLPAALVVLRINVALDTARLCVVIVFNRFACSVKFYASVIILSYYYYIINYYITIIVPICSTCVIIVSMRVWYVRYHLCIPSRCERSTVILFIFSSSNANLESRGSFEQRRSCGR